MDIIGAIVWDMSPEIFSIGIISIKWYSLMFVITFLAGFMIMKKIYTIEGQSNKRISIEDIDTLAIYVFIGTVIGARLGHCLLYSPEYYLSNPLEILKVWNGGLASHGGAIGILISLWLYSKKKPQYSFLWIVDRVVIVVALGGLFIRTGNFFNSEIIGKPTDMPWAVVFTSVDNIARHPGQLYEGIAYFVIFVVLYQLYITRVSKAPNANRGMLFGLFLSLVFFARFVIEYFKEIQSDFEVNLPIHMGQILSIPFCIIGIIIFILALNHFFDSRKNKLNNQKLNTVKLY